MKAITVCCGKGGVGKTFSALSIAVELGVKSDGNRPVLVVDLDPSTNTSTRICAVESRPVTVADLFEDMSLDPRRAIYPASPGYPGVSVMASSDRLDFVDQLIVKRKNPDSILKRILKKISHEYDVAIIDCPPSRGTLVANALVACDAYITPFGLDDASIDGVLAIYRLIEELVREEVLTQKPVNLGAFCTNYEKESSRATKHVINIASEYLHDSILDIRIPGTSHVREAVSHQATLQFDRKHKVCIAYQGLTNHIIHKLHLGGYNV
jgi:chromosome partitioning protein